MYRTLFWMSGGLQNVSKIFYCSFLLAFPYLEIYIEIYYNCLDGLEQKWTITLKTTQLE